MEETATSLFWIMLASVVAPLVAGLVPRKLLPEVVILLVLGVLIGPHAFELAEDTDSIELLRELGLGMLFLLAGYEIKLDELTGREGRRAGITWLCCLGVAFVAVWLLGLVDAIHAEVAVAIALTSTALGTLLPILKDSGLLTTRVGASVMKHGAYGELGPIAAMAVLLGARGPVRSMLLLALFALLAVGVSLFATQLRREGSRLLQLIRAGAETTGQTVVRLTMLLLVTLGLLAIVFDLDVVLGAFAAGIILRQLLPLGHESLELRLTGLAFGFLIPVFFVTSGMAIDPIAVAEEPVALAVFVASILLIRGGIVFVSERIDKPSGGRPPSRESAAVALYASTGLPIIVAVTSASVAAGQMATTNASVLVAGGAVTVLVCPLLATLLIGDPPQPAADTAEVPGSSEPDPLPDR